MKIFWSWSTSWLAVHRWIDAIPARACSCLHLDQMRRIDQRRGVLQIRQTTGQDALQLHAGDSVAVSASAATVEATDTERHRPAEWRLATLHLVFDAGDQGTVAGERLLIRYACCGDIIVRACQRARNAKCGLLAF